MPHVLIKYAHVLICISAGEGSRHTLMHFIELAIDKRSTVLDLIRIQHSLVIGGFFVGLEIHYTDQT